MSKNYTVIHSHSSLSLLDSCTDFKDYIDKAVELGQKAIAMTEHGNIYNFVAKKMYCDEQGVKYLHACEVYLTETHEEKVRDNYHTILIAKNEQGIKELNQLISNSNTEERFYYKPRISFDEFLNISDNVIKISACLASPLNRYRNRIKELENKAEELQLEHIRGTDDEDSFVDDNIEQEYKSLFSEIQTKIDNAKNYYPKLCEKYDYYEIQYHNDSEGQQSEYNKHLYELSKKYNKPLIVGTDTHSINKYKAECRGVLQKAKGIDYSNEDDFDLTYKTYEELVTLFKIQNSLSQDVVLEALENTNIMADSVEDFELDISFKYPKLYENDEEIFIETTYRYLEEKIRDGIILEEHRQTFLDNIEEEIRVFKKIGMCSFMLFMSELVTWCKENDIAVGYNRGSCGGSCVAYVTNITDLNPIIWKTVFSRFCNEDRVELGDIDLDIATEDRERVYNHIIEKFGDKYTSFILAIGTVGDKGTIDEIGRALDSIWKKNNPELLKEKSPYSLEIIAKIKREYESVPLETRKKYPDLFYYFDGIVNTPISQSMHPAGIIVSPITLSDNYGMCHKDGKNILQLDMECVHEISLLKYDILGLKNIDILKGTYKALGINYLKSHEINWDDQDVWADMLKSPVGNFQFESPYAHEMLKKFEPHSIFDMSLVTAAIRPSGESYRNRLMNHEVNKNPSELIDNLLKDNLNYLVYQEDCIKFLTDICGMSGSEADNTRRAIGRKDEEKLKEAIPHILEGYCRVSDKPRHIAEEEAKEFLRIIEDASSYMFGKNHSIGYCMIGYTCAYLRKYHPFEFLTSFFNCANNEDDISNGTTLANQLRIKIMPPKFRYSLSNYFHNEEQSCIYKGIASIKFLNSICAEELFALKDTTYTSFIELLKDISVLSINTKQLDILIKLNFFSEFGNIKYLLKIVQLFELFKSGLAKQMAISKITDEVLINIVKRYSRETSKNYMDLQTDSILLEMEEYMKSLNIDDFSLREKICWQEEFLGYIDLQTGLTEDRTKLMVLDIIPLKTKDKSKVWAYKFKTMSIGSGVKAELTVLTKYYKNEHVDPYDCIRIHENCLEKKIWNGYTNWYLNGYRREL